MSSEGQPIAEGVFTWPSDHPQLLASRCQRCSELTFPQQSSCPACTAEATEEVALSRRGHLWTWTIQRFPPPPPFTGDTEPFVPYGVGYIELPEGIRVESRLTVNDPDALEIGMEMELVVAPFRTDEEGRDLLTFAFAPVHQEPPQ